MSEGDERNAAGPVGRPDGRRARGLRRDLVAALRASGEIRTEPVRAAFAAVPRHLFVPGVSLSLAYADVVVPTKFDRGGGAISALSQPAIVAVMLEQLDVRPGMRVLEIGAGTGYNAALLAHLVGDEGHVVTVDLDEDLVEGAREHVAAARGAMSKEVPAQVEAVPGDGALGYPPGAPYDRIIATVGAADVPAAWLEQLAPAGKIVLPLRIRGGVTRSVVIERETQGSGEARAGGSRTADADTRATTHLGDQWRGSRLEVCSFMPLRGIADDLGDFLELTPDGLIGVSVYPEQRVGANLARALDEVGDERFTGVRVGAAESFGELDLYLTCALPGGMTRLSATGPAVASGALRPQFTWGAMCTVDDDSLAYLTLRQSSPEDELAQRWEIGVIGHGPRGSEMAAEAAAHIRTWDAEVRDAQPVLHLAQGDERERLNGRFLVDKPASRIAVDWE